VDNMKIIPVDWKIKNCDCDKLYVHI